MRNRYDDAYGVSRIRWQYDEPSSAGFPVLVEVWRSSLMDLLYNEPTKPQVNVQSRVEVRFFDDEKKKWMRIGYGGNVEVAPEGRVRRWAPLPSRNWHATITLDGWGKE